MSCLWRCWDDHDSSCFRSLGLQEGESEEQWLVRCQGKGRVLLVTVKGEGSIMGEK